MEHLDHPSPQFNDAKMARFCSFAPSSLLWGGRGLIVPFYSVQDCSLGGNATHLYPIVCVTTEHCHFNKINQSGSTRLHAAMVGRIRNNEREEENN